MHETILSRNKVLASRIIDLLSQRHMHGDYVETKEEAGELVLKMIPEGSSVGWGGSASLDEINIKDDLRSGNYRVYDRDNAKDDQDLHIIERQCLTADVFLMGTNAITEDGQLVNLDGNGNRVAALAFGPDKVIVIAGINKICPDLDDAVKRVRRTAAPTNAFRFPGDTPCRKFGICGDCRMEDCICSQLLITRGSMTKDRVNVVIVGEPLGF
ncbi:MAG: lactate utilization protein [Anaerovoracaceae bacterium]